MTKSKKIVEFLKDNQKYGYTTKFLAKKLKVKPDDIHQTVYYNKSKIGSYKVNKSVYYMYEQV